MNKVKMLADRLLIELKPFAKKIEIAGSIRRKVQNPGDIDILIIPRDKNGITQKLISRKAEFLSRGEEKLSVKIDGVQTDIVFTNQQEWATCLMYFTGPKGANIWNRVLAQKKGLKLNQHGLFNMKTGRRIPTPTEASIYAALDKTYRRPENRGEKR